MSSFQRALRVDVSPKRALKLFLISIVSAVVFSLVMFSLAKVETTKTRVTDPARATGVVQVQTLSGETCSGFRISAYAALTAAHCFEFTTDPAEIYVVLSPLAAPGKDMSGGSVCTSDSLHIPESFSTSPYAEEWDFALVTFNDCWLPSDAHYTLGLMPEHGEMGTLGYPGSEEVYSLWESSGSEIFSVFNIFKRMPDSILTTSVESSPGTSGSVVFTQDKPNVAVGISVLGYGDGSSGIIGFDEERLALIQQWMSE